MTLTERNRGLLTRQFCYYKFNFVNMSLLKSSQGSNGASNKIEACVARETVQRLMGRFIIRWKGISVIYSSHFLLFSLTYLVLTSLTLIDFVMILIEFTTQEDSLSYIMCLIISKIMRGLELKFFFVMSWVFAVWKLISHWEWKNFMRKPANSSADH